MFAFCLQLSLYACVCLDESCVCCWWLLLLKVVLRRPHTHTHICSLARSNPYSVTHVFECARACVHVCVLYLGNAQVWCVRPLLWVSVHVCVSDRLIMACQKKPQLCVLVLSPLREEDPERGEVVLRRDLRLCLKWAVFIKTILEEPKALQRDRNRRRSVIDCE